MHFRTGSWREDALHRAITSRYRRDSRRVIGIRHSRYRSRSSFLSVTQTFLYFGDTRGEKYRGRTRKPNRAGPGFTTVITPRYNYQSFGGQCATLDGLGNFYPAYLCALHRDVLSHMLA